MVTISATEARVRFGELIRRVSGGSGPVVVERGGLPAVVVISLDDYQSLLAATQGDEWRAALERAVAVGVGIRARRTEELPPPEPIIAQERAKRDAELLGLH